MHVQKFQKELGADSSGSISCEMDKNDTIQNVFDILLQVFHTYCQAKYQC